MTPFNFYCRVRQKVFKFGMGILPWKKPSLLEGEGALEKLPGLILTFGFKRVLIVTGKTHTRLGMTARLKEILEKAGIFSAVFDGVQPNPIIENVEEAVKLYKDNDCSCFIAFGGGSPMDCAKIAAARIARPELSVNKMKGLMKIMRKTPTIFAVPTTAGSGSETTAAAVITSAETHEKFAIADVKLIPEFAVLDPSMTKELPPHVVSTTGMDALCHAVEAYIGKGNTRETAACAIEAVKLIFDNLLKAYKSGDLESRKSMQRAAYLAGVAFTRAYVGNVHAISHALSGRYNVPHGLANAVVMPYVLEAYGKKAEKKLAELADAVNLGGSTEAEKAGAFIAAIRNMNAEMNIPDKIDGIKEEDISDMCGNAFKEANPTYPVPKIFKIEDFRAVYDKIRR